MTSEVFCDENGRERIKRKSDFFTLALFASLISGAAYAQDDPVRQMQDERLRRSQQEALDNYNKRAKQQQQTQWFQQMQQRHSAQVAINLDTGRDFLTGLDSSPDVAVGYTVGVFAVGRAEKHICTLGDTGYDEMAVVVRDFIASNPAKLDAPLAPTVAQAFIQKWPCAASHK